MSRLKRQLKPYLSTLRLSTADLIVFYEGREFDPVFYGQIAQRYQSDTGLSVELRRANELPTNAELEQGGSGGRVQLVCAANLWAKYQTKRAHSWKNRKALAFCIDKDVEDICGLPEYVPTIIRTRLHSVENHLFRTCQIEPCIETALSLSPGEFRANSIGLNDGWLDRIAARWKEWIVFCLLALRLEATGIANYSKSSFFNRPSHAENEGSVSGPHFERLRVAVGWDVQSFQKMADETRKLVEELHANGHFDRIFKGKWYIDILFSYLASTAYSSIAKSTGKMGLLIALRTSFKLSTEDYRHYRESFDLLLTSR